MNVRVLKRAVHAGCHLSKLSMLLLLLLLLLKMTFSTTDLITTRRSRSKLSTGFTGGDRFTRKEQGS